MKRVSFVLATLMCVGDGLAGAQMPASAPTSQAAAAPAADTPKGKTMELMQPTMNSLPATLSTLRVDKWKAPNPVKDAALNNITSIKRDLTDTLPPLLKAADATPKSASALLAVMQNVNALYDVLLHVGDAAEIAAPQAQSADLAQGVSGLLVARRGLEEMMRTAVTGQEQQVKDLQKNLSDKTAAAATVPPPCPPPAPAKTAPKKKAAVKKPAAQ
jgi:hypothetical protein